MAVSITNTTNTDNAGNAGNAGNNAINCTTQSMINGSCSMNTYKFYGGSINPRHKDLKGFTQDLVGGITMFIGTIVLLALIYSGILMIWGGADEKYYETGKKGVIYSIIGLLLVGFSYGIIRLVQLLAQG